MEESEKIRIASLAVGKNMAFDELYYCDDMYGHEDMTDDVWEYVTECKEIGSIAFREKYKDVELYCGLG